MTVRRVVGGREPGLRTFSVRTLAVLPRVRPYLSERAGGGVSLRDLLRVIDIFDKDPPRTGNGPEQRGPEFPGPDFPDPARPTW